MAPSNISLDELRIVLRQRLESLGRAGIRQLPRRPVPTVETVSAGAADRLDEPRESTPADDDESPLQPTAPTMPKPSLKQRNNALQLIQDEVAACTLCTELAETRTQTVFGVGNSDARLCFLGEAPGADEDRQGEPFVGRAGKLLTDIIEKGMGLRREDVYILNILKCRPPGNRNPTDVEAGNCRGFLDRQLELIRPEFICCLGTIAAQNLLDTTMPIGKMRGNFYRYGEARVIATYHPAYLLRNPSAKRQVWEDIRLLMREMGIEPK